MNNLFFVQRPEIKQTSKIPGLIMIVIDRKSIRCTFAILGLVLV